MTHFLKCFTADWVKEVLGKENYGNEKGKRVISESYWTVDGFLKITEVVLGRPISCI